MSSEREYPKDSREPAGPAGHSAEEAMEERLFDEALSGYAVAARAVAERPQQFWDSQARSIRTRLKYRRPNVDLRRLIPVWVALGLVIVTSLIVSYRQPSSVKPDFAAGSDQQLLIEVELALRRQAPAPLEPATLILAEMFPSVRILAEP